MSDTLISGGLEALATGAWERARDAFQAAVQQSRGPEALEGLATAYFWTIFTVI
jgi:hypothetical protein